ncbi:MAG: TldD/PmbA family protein [Myxococcales bacterium]|nr:TldD/PmbA family protein [Myxococcales bacterium]
MIDAALERDASAKVTLRGVRERSETLEVRRGTEEPAELRDDWGAMLSVTTSRGGAYAASSDLSQAGLGRALERAFHWIERTDAERGLEPRRGDEAGASGPLAAPSGARGSYEAPVGDNLLAVPVAERSGWLHRASDRLGAHSDVVDWSASLWCADTESLLLDSLGGRVEQRIAAALPQLRATAHRAGETQSRTLAGHNHARQAGASLLDEIGFFEAASRIASEAVELLTAPNCESGRFPIVLAPDQMVLQIHESIGHPLELDRILGDERNYAGTSFVTTEMFGSYRYGSDLLNVSFDPDVPGQFASYAFDDAGTPAERALLIERGILKRPLGGALSGSRAGLAHVANARASSWNRPPIDRMANLNIEPGDETFRELLAPIEDGFYFETNCSWSIDHERNKFQFGCERGRRIRGGELAEVVKNPNYRGRSADFWRGLDGVGNRSLWEVLGTPYCGKGEPNQIIRVGHASPPCRFLDVDVFGGAA